MKSFEELVQLWASGPRAPAGQGVVRRICLRLGGGLHDVPSGAELSVEHGVIGDRWRISEDPERLCQVTLMSASAAEYIAHAGAAGHQAGDNFLVDLDLSVAALPVGSRLRLGSALLEITAEPHLGCKKFNQRFGAGALRWVNHVDHRPLRLRGVNARVLEGGRVDVGSSIEVVP